MKQIINNLLYDTDTSDLIYTDSVRKRKLYRTKNGNFFTFFNNGEIVPKSEQAAKEYLGKFDIDAYIKVFGKPDEA